MDKKMPAAPNTPCTPASAAFDLIKPPEKKMPAVPDTPCTPASAAFGLIKPPEKKMPAVPDTPCTPATSFIDLASMPTRTTRSAARAAAAGGSGDPVRVTECETTPKAPTATVTPGAQRGMDTPTEAPSEPIDLTEPAPTTAQQDVDIDSDQQVQEVLRDILDSMNGDLDPLDFPRGDDIPEVNGKPTMEPPVTTEPEAKKRKTSSA